MVKMSIIKWENDQNFINMDKNQAEKCFKST